MSPKSNKKEPDGLSMLNCKITPEIAELYNKKCDEVMGMKNGFKSDDNPTVTKYKYDEMEKDYKERIQKLQESIDSLKKEKENLRKERDSLTNRADALSRELKAKTSELDPLKARIKDLEEQNGKLTKENRENFDATSSQEYKALQSRCEGLEKRIGKLDEEKTSLKDGNDALLGQIESLKQQLEDAQNLIPEPETEDETSDGTVEWSSPTEFRSDLFTAPRYRVKLDRKGRYISFKADVEGRCVNDGGTICIPAMERYIGFSKGIRGVRISNDTIVMFF